MPGPVPKDPSVRARRNKSSTRATLSEDHDIEAPPLPDGVDWLPKTTDWWQSLWKSGLAPEYLDIHKHSLFRVALLFNQFWHPETELKQKLDIQVRLEKAEADFGLNPMAMRRLEWQIEAAEDSKAKGMKRRGQAEPVSAPAPDDDAPDPRLRLISG